MKKNYTASREIKERSSFRVREERAQAVNFQLGMHPSLVAIKGRRGGGESRYVSRGGET